MSKINTSEIESSLSVMEEIVSTPKPFTLLPEHSSQLRSVLKKQLSGWVFRKVQKTIVREQNLIKAVSHFPTEEGGVKYNTIKPQDYYLTKHKMSSKVHEQNLELHYSEFSFFTTNRPYPTATGDSYLGEQIYAHSKTYAEIDFTANCDLKHHFRKRTVPPRKDDLVCMLIDPPSRRGRKPTAKAWFLCSGQFYHMFNAIMYDDHQSFKGKEGEKLQTFLMGGNRLMSNTYMKWLLCHRDNNLVPGEKEMNKMYRRIRSEESSKRWVHIYAALVLMARYGEMPTLDNIPNNASNGPLMTYWRDYHGQEEWPSMKFWSLPQGYLKKILEKWTEFKPETYSKSWGEIEECIRGEWKPELPKRNRRKPPPKSKKNYPPLKEEEVPVKPVKKIIETVKKIFEEIDELYIPEGASWADLCC